MLKDTSEAKGQLFISFSHQNKSFVQNVLRELTNLNWDIFVDWQSIPPSANYWQEIEEAILSCDAVIFIVSKDSINSHYCEWEIRVAQENGKKIIPIFLKFKPNAFKLRYPTIKSVIEKVNAIRCESDNVDVLLRGTIEDAILLDLIAKKKHTWLLLRAKKWENSGKQESHLMVGADLCSYNDWIDLHCVKGSCDLEVTNLQKEYVQASNRLERENNIRRVIKQSTLKRVANDHLVALQFALEAVRMLKQLELSSQALFYDCLCNCLLSLNVTREENRLIGHTGIVNAVVFSPNDERILSGGADGTVRSWTKQGLEWRKSDHCHLGSSTFVLPDGDVVPPYGNEVQSIAISSDGKLIASGGQDRTTRLWNCSGEPLSVFLNDSYGVYSDTEGVSDVAFSPDAKLIASANGDAVVRLWHLYKGTEQEIKGHKGPVKSVTFSPDGNLLATIDSYGTIRMWNLEGDLLKKYDINASKLVFSPDGKYFAIGKPNRTIAILTINGVEQALLYGKTTEDNHFPKYQHLTSLGFSPDGKYVAAGDMEGLVYIWSINLSSDSSKPDWPIIRLPRLILSGHTGAVRSVAFDSTSRRIASGAEDGEIRIWRLNAVPADELTAPKTFYVENSIFKDVECINDRNFLLAVGYENKGLLDVEIRTNEGEKLHSFSSHAFSVSNTKCLGHAGNRFAVCDYLNEVTDILNFDGTTLSQFTGPLTTIALSPNGELLGGIEKLSTAFVYNISSKEKILLKCQDREVLRISLEDPEPKMQPFCGEDIYLNSITFSPCSKFVFAGTKIQSVECWDVSGRALWSIDLDDKNIPWAQRNVSHIEVSSDGLFLLVFMSFDDFQSDYSLRDSNIAKLIDLETQTVSTTIRANEWCEELEWCTFHPNGKIIATSSNYATRLWNLEGELLLTLNGAASKVAFSPTGNTLVGLNLNGDSNVGVWDLSLAAILRSGEKWLSNYRLHKKLS